MQTPMPPNAETLSKIEGQIRDNPIMLYMKGTPDFPQCGFSSVVVQILDILGAEYATFNVLTDMDVRQGIKVFSDWPTIPQLYVQSEFVGGCDIIKEMFEAGELKTLFADKGLLT